MVRGTALENSLPFLPDIRNFGLRSRLVLLIGAAMFPLVPFLAYGLNLDHVKTLVRTRNEVVQESQLAAAKYREALTTAEIFVDGAGDVCPAKETSGTKAQIPVRMAKVVSASGAVVCDSGPPDVVDFVAGGRAMQSASGEHGFVRGNLILHDGTSHPSLAVVSIRPDARGNTAIAAIDIPDLLEKAAIPSTFRQDEVFVVEPATGMVLAFSSSPTNNLPAGLAAGKLLEAIRESKKGGTVDAAGMDGTDRIQGFFPLEGFGDDPPVIVVAASRDAVLVPVRQRSLSVMAIAAAVMSVFMGATWWLGHWMQIQPVKRVVAAVRRIGTGNFDVPTGMEKWQAPEMRELGSTLDAVAAQLLHARHAEAKLAASEARYRVMTEHTIDFVTSFDMKGRRTFASPASMDLLGLTSEEMMGIGVHDLVHPEDLGVVDDMIAVFAKGEIVSGARLRVAHADGRYVWVEINAKPTSDRTEIVCVLRDVTERKLAEEKLEQANAKLAALAATDGLTGLSNRRAFDAALKREFAKAETDGTELGLVLIDVDRFKNYNDTYGHQEGDECLKVVASALSGILKGRGVAARYGGEELAVVIPRTSHAEAMRIAEDIRSGIAGLGLLHSTSEFGFVTASVGVATFSPGHGVEDSDLLLRRADVALYSAKATGRNRVRCAPEDGMTAADTVESVAA
jgi:diguanylate cyclase (GGDEF)-like protein/PAS domain S-box-containing protein